MAQIPSPQSFVPTSGGTITGALTVTGAINGGSAPGGPLWELVAATPVAGFAKQNGTPTIVTWTTPNDALNHRFFIHAEIHTTIAETGGAVGPNFTFPDASAWVASNQIFPGGAGIGINRTLFTGIAGPNTVVNVAQTSALTAGASLMWIEIWGS